MNLGNVYQIGKSRTIEKAHIPIVIAFVGSGNTVRSNQGCTLCKCIAQASLRSSQCQFSRFTKELGAVLRYVSV